MTKLPLYFGYAGALPFILFMIVSMVLEDVDEQKALTFVQMSYGAMITSFLGGVHWGQAIPSNNSRQLSFAMVPTIASLGLMIWTFLVDPVLPLIGLAALFWGIYFADRKLMPEKFIPEGYFQYRRNLTIIVFVTLVISAIAYG